MVDLVLQLVVAPAVVGAATLAARRFGQRAGGVVSAFPAIVGPVLLVAALDHGAAFAARAANGTLLGLVALAGFALVYGRVAARVGWPANSRSTGWPANPRSTGWPANARSTGWPANPPFTGWPASLRGTRRPAIQARAGWPASAPRTGWPASLTAAWVTAAVLGLAVTAVAPGPPAGLIAAAVSLATAHRLLPVSRGAAPAVAVPAWDLPLRMALTALLTVSLTAAANRLGPVAGGMLAALPVLASILAVFTHARFGAAAVGELLRGMLAGMAGFVCFCALVAALAQPAGIAVAFAAATVAALAVQIATARIAAAPPAAVVPTPARS